MSNTSTNKTLPCRPSVSIFLFIESCNYIDLGNESHSSFTQRKLFRRYAWYRFVFLQALCGSISTSFRLMFTAEVRIKSLFFHTTALGHVFLYLGIHPRILSHRKDNFQHFCLVCSLRSIAALYLVSKSTTSNAYLFEGFSLFIFTRRT